MRKATTSAWGSSRSGSGRSAVRRRRAARRAAARPPDRGSSAGSPSVCVRTNVGVCRGSIGSVGASDTASDSYAGR